MHCPKCNGEMGRENRSGVTIDECHNCGGIFLDRGELEHLVQAENAHYGGGHGAPTHGGGHQSGGFLGGLLGGGGHGGYGGGQHGERGRHH